MITRPILDTSDTARRARARGALGVLGWHPQDGDGADPPVPSRRRRCVTRPVAVMTAHSAVSRTRDPGL